MAVSRPLPLDVFDCPLGGTALIEASAGTGKTWTICGLYLRLLLERRLEVQQILVVTFTKAATAELRERIRNRIADTLARLRAPADAAAADPFVDQLLQTVRATNNDGPNSNNNSNRSDIGGNHSQSAHHAAGDDALARRLDQALQTFDEAAIFTIHGFCQRALGDTPLGAGMPMALELADDSTLHADVVHDFWRRRIAGQALPPALAAQLIARKDSPASHAALLKRRVAKPLAQVYWPAGTGSSGDHGGAALAPADSPTGDNDNDNDNDNDKDSDNDNALLAAHTALRALWLAERDTIIGCVSEALPRLSAVSYKPNTIATAATSWDALLAHADPWQAPPALDKLDLFTSTRLKPKAKQAAPQPHAFFDAAEVLLALRSAAGQRQLLARLALLRELLDHGPAALRQAKRERRVTAFDDMLFNLHERLTSGQWPGLAAALLARYPAALIDEFQDTDPLQFEIFQAIYGSDGADRHDASRDGHPDAHHDADHDAHHDADQGANHDNQHNHQHDSQRNDDRNDNHNNKRHTQRNNQQHGPRDNSDAPLFLVGDPKQAIYSFRNADLHTYLQARQHARAAYTLADNQRSTAPLLQALNALFGANPRAFMLDGLDYTPVGMGAKPRPPLVDNSSSGSSSSGQAALQVWSLPATAQGTPLPKLLARQRSAHACAGEIARLLGAAQQGLVTLGGRALAAGDVAVLVRTHAQGALMRRALSALGVGCVELSQASVFASTDAEELARVLAAVQEPSREPLLRAALATEVMGHDAAAINALSADDEGALLAVLTRFAGYRQTWLQHGVGAMLRQWMLDERVSARLLQRPDGERRLTNLLHLAECLQDAAQRQPAPEAVLRWLQMQRQQGAADEAAQLRLESDRNLVQIITIHKSKGLEYPLVFCPFLWDGHPGQAPASEGREYHDANGQTVLDFRDLGDATASIKAQIALERSAETQRLLYVALTRAVHRCVVVRGHYGTGKGAASTSESGRGPLNWLVAGAGVAPADWLAGKPPAPAALDAAWEAFAARHAPAIALRALPNAAVAPLQPSAPAPDTLAALPPPAFVRPGWWIGSYSSLTQGARHEAAAVDHDVRVSAVAEDGPGVQGNGQDSDSDSDSNSDKSDAPPPLINADDILRFPRGAAAGECMHAVLERVDFTKPAGWPAAARTALALRPQTPRSAGIEATDPAVLHTMLMRMLSDVVHTPLLADGARLADVPMSCRLVELEFNLPSVALDAQALTRLLAAHGYPAPAFTFGRLQGYLRGFIDLVFQHGGRFYIADWKSNHLGDRMADYGAQPMARAMADHGYHLQALLYTLALHRYLQHRLPGYDYDQHMGGALYLFVRGVRPMWTYLDAAGQVQLTGVYAHRPPRQVIDALGALLDTPPSTPPGTRWSPSQDTAAVTP